MIDSKSKIEPSTLPQGIGSMTVAYTLFIAIDPSLFWEVVGHFYALYIQYAVPDPHVRMTSDLTLGTGIIIGLVTSLSFVWFPLLLLDGRLPVAISAFRKLCWSLIVSHIVLVVLVLVTAFSIGFHREFLVVPFALIAIPATPFLYALAKPLLTMRWLDLKAPPETWEKLIGIDGSGRKTIEELGGAPSSMALALFATPIACFRARWYWRGTMAGLLWVGGLLLLAFDPLRSIVAFAASAAIGRQVAMASVPRGHIDRPASQEDRIRRVKSIFTPVRLKSPPFALATGLIGYLFVLPFLPVVVWYALILVHTKTIIVLSTTSTMPAAIIPFLTIPLALPSAGIMPFGFRFAIWWYRLTGITLVVVYVAMVGFFWRYLFWPFGVVPAARYPVLAPIALLLTALAPLVVATALSLRPAGTLPPLSAK